VSIVLFLHLWTWASEGGIGGPRPPPSYLKFQPRKAVFVVWRGKKQISPPFGPPRIFLENSPRSPPPGKSL